MRIASIRLDRDPGVADALYPLLCDQERTRAARFRFERDRCRLIVARGALRELLGAELDVHPQSVVLEYGSHGKPQLGGPYAGNRKCKASSTAGRARKHWSRLGEMA